MEKAPTKWLPDPKMVMEDPPFSYQYQMNPPRVLCHSHHSSISQLMISFNPGCSPDTLEYQHYPDNESSQRYEPGKGNHPCLLVPSQAQDPDEHYGSAYYKSTPGSARRSPSFAKEHVIAERKRREKLNQKFIALSSVVPGIKKMDKASVLGDATKYLKHLQEQVQSLEDQAAQKTTESIILVKRSHVYMEDDQSSSSAGEDSGSWFDEEMALPAIEAKVSDKKNVLIRVHCGKQKGCLQKILGAMERLNLRVITSNALPFGTSILDVTITAKIDVDCQITATDLVNSLRQALLESMGVSS